MKKAILLCGMLLALTASASFAAGVNMRWDNCFGDAGVTNKTSLCTNNLGSRALRGSFEVDADIPNMSGVALIIDAASDSPNLPSWWQFIAPNCRPSSLSIQQFNGTNCFDWSNLQASVNIAAYELFPHGPNTARVKCLNAVKADQVVTVSPGIEWAVFQLTIDSQKTAGLGSCGGCLIPVCLVFNECFIGTSDNLHNTTLNFPAHTVPINSDYAAWQGGGVPVVNGRQGCPLAVATKNATWGSVKALYR